MCDEELPETVSLKKAVNTSVFMAFLLFPKATHAGSGNKLQPLFLNLLVFTA
jgi:hypothetical protein